MDCGNKGSNVKRILFLFLFAGLACRGDELRNVIIEVHAPATDDTTNLYIAGNNAQMGNWRPDRAQLDYAGNFLWHKSFRFETGSIIEYKITQGSWDSEAADENGRPWQNSVLKVNADTTARSTVLNWKTGNDSEVAGQITGQVCYHRQLAVKGLLPRDVIVWLPPEYDKAPDSPYPVLYMNDGQNIFDPNTAAFKVDWQMDETADSLIRAGEIEPLIIVGIYNTAQRTQEYTPGKLGDRYRDFVINTIKPMIDATYRTRSESEFTAVGGSSAGGIVSFMLAWEHPKVFSKAICMSPAFRIGEIDYVQNVRNFQGAKKNIRVYIDNGGVGLEEKLQPGIDEMMMALDERGYQRGVDYFWVHDKEARHFEAAWGKRMPQALKLLFGIAK